MHPALTRDCTKPRLFVWMGLWCCAVGVPGTDDIVWMAASSADEAYRIASGVMLADALAGLRAGQLPARVS